MKNVGFYMLPNDRIAFCLAMRASLVAHEQKQPVKTPVTQG